MLFKEAKDIIKQAIGQHCITKITSQGYISDNENRDMFSKVIVSLSKDWYEVTCDAFVMLKDKLPVAGISICGELCPDRGNELEFYTKFTIELNQLFEEE